MRSSLRCFRTAVAPLLVLGATLSLYGVANACGEKYSDGRKFTPDGFMVTDAPEMSEAADESDASASCPAPPCSHSTCATINPSTPFQRLPGYEALPISRWAGCFGIAKRDASFYIQLTLDGPGNGFHRNVSTDGGFTWTAGPVVIAPNTNWWTGIKCPDLQYLPNGDLLLYFRAAGASGNPTGIARGVSTDDGVTWTFNSGPVLTSPVVGFAVDNPSVLRRGANSYMMAYTLVCAGPGVTGPFQLAETYLAVSSDGINWTHSVNNPALTPGACGAWDQGGVCNPQLEADPISSSKLHLFYTGADWNGYTTRGCTKIGHAISTNNGRTWCKTGVVLDHPPSTSVAWDDVQYMASNFTIEPNNVIRMYYWAEGTGVGGALGIAEAAWPLTGGCGPAPMDDTGWSTESKPPLAGSGSELGTGIFLQAQPNPTSAGVVIQHNLAQGNLEGSGSLSIVDVQGRQVAQVWRGDLREAPAQFDWDGLGSGGTRVAAGRYLIRLEAHGAVVATGWVTVMQ